MGKRGMYQTTLRVVGSDGPPISRTTYSNPEDIPKLSSEEFQERMLSDLKIFLEAMDRETAELEGRPVPDAADPVETSIL